MSRLLASVCRQMNCSFTLAGEEESTLLLLSPEMFLPAVAAVAEVESCSLIHKSLGAVFTNNPDAMLGQSVLVPPVESDPGSLIRALFYIHAAQRLFGLRENASIELAPVVERFDRGLLSEGGWPVAIVSPNHVAQSAGG